MNEVQTTEAAVGPNPRQFLSGRITRSSEDRVIAGVGGGIAARLGIPAPYARAALVSLSAAGGIGLILYAVVWIGAPDEEEYGSLVIADRPASTQQQFGLGLAFVSVLLVLETFGLGVADLIWSVTLLSFGGALVWERSNAESRNRLSNLADAAKPRSRTQIVLGTALMGGGIIVILTSLDEFQTLGPIAVAVLLTAVGFMLAFGPWVLGLFDDLTQERRARIRSEERAELAAQLHDSVLQTLALIQRSDDPQRMTTLARAQERDLRSWLFTPERDHGDETVGEAVTIAAARVEAAFNVPIEVVVVGDRPTTSDSSALIGATAEAMANAAEHSEARQVSVYIECTAEGAEAWITDHGKGFDLAAIDEDRKGITESILARMSRSGGSAEIESTPGEGTEVHLKTGTP